MINFWGSSDGNFLNKTYYRSEENVDILVFNNITMWNLVKLMPYLSSIENITLDDYTEINEDYSVCGIKAAYEYPLITDGKDMSLKAIYDSEGNLLTISVPDDFGLTSTTWDFDTVISIYDMLPEDVVNKAIETAKVNNATKETTEVTE